MLKITIPGFRGETNLTDLILDYNGTLARDGELIIGVADRLTSSPKVFASTY